MPSAKPAVYEVEDDAEDRKWLLCRYVSMLIT
jgi:hypothetical protein